MLNLRQFLSVLRHHGEIVDVHHPVDPHLELAEIHRRVIEEEGKALFFHRVKGSPFPVVTNLFGTKRRVEMAFPQDPKKWLADLIHLATHNFPPRPHDLWHHRHHLKRLLHVGMKKKRGGPVQECVQEPPNLEELPLLTSWPLDGGAFMTLPLVYTEPPGGGPSNLGIYRIHRYDAATTGLHWQIGKGGGYHYHLAQERDEALPVTIFLGGPPALMLSAIAPLPENVPELLLASLLQGKKLERSPVVGHPHPLISECEFALVGRSPAHVRRLEGPFGDHYGYYSWAHDFPIFECSRLYHRKDAIYPATVVGKPRQEDFFIGDFLQELLSPLFPVVMPGVIDLWSYGETGFHSLAAAVVKERFYRECMASAFRILGEGQLMLTKVLLLTDQPVSLRNFPELLTTVLERFSPETDLFIFSNLSLDTLDYTGPTLNQGSRAIFLGVGEKRKDLPQAFQGPLTRPLTAARPFCPGCLVVQGPPYSSYSDLSALCEETSFALWPLIIVVDDIDKALANTAAFLWTTFTRFEPAADLYAKTRIHRHHLVYEGPILIDARMKPSYPPEVEVDAATAKKVSENWKSYFDTPRSYPTC